MVAAARHPRCQFGKCGGSIVVNVYADAAVVCCILCGREPGAYARAASPADRAAAELEAFQRRRPRHYRPKASGE